MPLQDKIGREEIVSKICGLIDSLGKDKNFCLAINGAWGSGKSFVLGLIEEKLSKKQEFYCVSKRKEKKKTEENIVLYLVLSVKKTWLRKKWGTFI